MQIAFITIEDPTEDGREVWLNLQNVEALKTDEDGDTALEMRSGRVHYSSLPIKEIFDKIADTVNRANGDFE